MLVCKNLSYKYKKVNNYSLYNISCEFPFGTTTLLTGSSGSGKTTLIKCLSGLCDYQGNVFLFGKELKTFNSIERSNNIGIVFQDFNLFSNLTALENCIQPLVKVNKITYAKAKKTASSWLDKLRMKDYINRYPNQLSGGQKQRVALARSLVKKVQFLILDEPTSSLDRQSNIELLAIINTLQQEGITLLIVTHDRSLIKNLGKVNRLEMEELQVYHNSEAIRKGV